MKQNEFSISERTGKITGFIEKQHDWLLNLEAARIWAREEEAKAEMKSM